MDRATVRVECDPAAAASATGELREHLAHQVRRKLKNTTNINFEVEILEPGSLERAVSKAKRVQDHRG